MAENRMRVTDEYWQLAIKSDGTLSTWGQNTQGQS